MTKTIDKFAPRFPQSRVVATLDEVGGWKRQYIGKIKFTVSASDGFKSVVSVPTAPHDGPRRIDITAEAVEFEKEGVRALVRESLTVQQLRDLIHRDPLSKSAYPLPSTQNNAIPQSNVIEVLNFNGGWNRWYIGKISIIVTSSNELRRVVSVLSDSTHRRRHVEISAGIVALEKDDHTVRVNSMLSLDQLQSLYDKGHLPKRSFEAITGDVPQCFNDLHEADGEYIKLSVCPDCSTSLSFAKCVVCGKETWFEHPLSRSEVHRCDRIPHHNFRR